MDEQNTKFSIGQKIVYPSQGVGKITEIFDKDFNGNVTSYYKIYLEVSDMNVMVPTEKATSLGIRAIVSKEDAQKALDMINEDFAPPTSDWKLRYQMNLELLKKGSINDIAEIVRSLYQRSKVKELPIQERKLYDNAKKILIDEIADALELSEKEVEAMLHAKLEPLGLKVEKKSAYADDDDFDDDLEEETKSNDSDGDDSDDDEDGDD